MTSAAGDTRTAAVFLPAGRYRVVVRAVEESGAFVDLDYTLSGATIDDPLGPRVVDVTDEPFTFEDRMRILVAVAVFRVR